MSLSLPQCSDNKYPVGSTTFATPVQPSVTFGTATLNDQPALVLDEVAFTAYYPADVTAGPSKGVDWLLRPLNENLKGIVMFAESIPSWIVRPVVYFYGALLKIPVFCNAPLLKAKEKPWPLVIFSHGLGGSRTAYSQICSRLAASGRVVLAIEHRDGTATCCVSRTWDEDGSRRSRVVHYMAEKDLKRPETSEEALLPLRRDQLEFRRHEVYTVYHTFVSMLHRRHPLQVETLDGSDIDWSSWTASDDQPLVEHSRDVALAGHSFGGCTMFYILSTPPPSWAAPIPVTKTLIHDPWLDPIPSPGPTPLDDYKVVSDITPSASSEETLAVEEQAKSLPDLLVINSQGFTLWDEHFERLRSVVNAWGLKAKLLTLVKSQHPHFSDFLVLPLIPGRKTALKFMNSISRLSDAFLDGRIDEQLTLEPTRTMEVEVVGKKKDAYGKPQRTLKGIVGDIIVHS